MLNPAGHKKGWSIICRPQVVNYLSAAMVKYVPALTPDPEVRDITTLYGFNDQFADYLTGRYGAVSYTNMALPGDKTCDLQAKLQDPAVRTLVRNARFMTVSIGGNNLLGPAIEAIFGLWGVDPADYTDPDGKAMLDALAAAIAPK